jgi:hypothetical protein
MSQILEILRYLRALDINPLAAVVVVALVAAFAEQRWLRKRTPDFSTAYRDIRGRPPKPPGA